jgi:hypothetical protein
MKMASPLILASPRLAAPAASTSALKSQPIARACGVDEGGYRYTHGFDYHFATHNDSRLFVGEMAGVADAAIVHAARAVAGQSSTGSVPAVHTRSTSAVAASPS